VPAAWQAVHAAVLCLAWLPVAGPLAVIALTPEWQAAQPLPVVPQAGVTTKVAATGLAWQEAAEQVVPAEPLVLLSVA
jgi:hypothetical protein